MKRVQYHRYGGSAALRLEEVERERSWPLRSAKIVLQLGLDRLARHYGLHGEAHGKGKTAIRTWLADDAEFVVGVRDGT